jgi:hypothetical protein
VRGGFDSIYRRGFGPHWTGWSHTKSEKAGKAASKSAELSVFRPSRSSMAMVASVTDRGKPASRFML